MYPVVQVLAGGQPVNAELCLWGREQRPGWWAPVCWRHPIRRPGQYSQLVSVAAWVAAEHLRPVRGGTDTSTVPRVRLPDDQTQWPVDRLRPRWDGTFLGAWSGGPLPLSEPTEP